MAERFANVSGVSVRTGGRVSHLLLNGGLGPAPSFVVGHQLDQHEQQAQPDIEHNQNIAQKKNQPKFRGG